jgi:nucleotide-binding universal stress UspA family protein
VTTAHSDPATGEWAGSHSPVVVGVDGSERNRSAVEWAANEAARTGADLVLSTVVEDDTPRRSPHSSPHLVSTVRQHAQAMLEGIAKEAGRTVPAEQVSIEVVTGSPDAELVSHFPTARMIVLGKRGLGAISRVLVGSTSLAVAGRAESAVAIIPDTWIPQGHDALPLVVGVDPYRAHDQLLHLAFRRAERLDVPLVAVHGWETPTAALMGGAAVDPGVAQWKAESEAEFDRVLEVWRKRFPSVHLEAMNSDLHPATAVLDAGEHAQLVILGRHSNSRFTGFAFGSVTRAVLHYAKCPVLVIPTDKA